MIAAEQISAADDALADWRDIVPQDVDELYERLSWVTRYETLKTREETWEDLEEEDSYVKTGDPVVQVLSDPEGRDESESELAEEAILEATSEAGH